MKTLMDLLMKKEEEIKACNTFYNMNTKNLLDILYDEKKEIEEYIELYKEALNCDLDRDNFCQDLRIPNKENKKVLENFIENGYY